MRSSFLLRYQEGLRPRLTESGTPADQAGKVQLSQSETVTVTEVGGETTHKDPKRRSFSAFAHHLNGE